MSAGTSETTERPALRDRLRTALTTAMKARDRRTASVLRATLAAIDNAEAVEIGADPVGAPFGRLGPGAADVARRELAEADIVAVVRSEIADRLAAAREYETVRHHERGTALRREADALIALL